MIKVGVGVAKCPSAHLLKASDASEKSFNLADYSGKYLVLFFYPKDNTPGCTIESIGFSKKIKSFHDLGAEVLGISKDSISSHGKFISKHNLQMDLISDEDTKICEFFKVLKEKSMFGKKYMGIERSTFIIGPDGKLLHEWRGVKVLSHVDEVLKTLKEISF